MHRVVGSASAFITGGGRDRGGSRWRWQKRYREFARGRVGVRPRRGPRPRRVAGVRPDGEELALFNRLVGAVLFANPRLRSAAADCRQPTRAAGPVAVCHLRRPAHRAGADWGPRSDERWSTSSCDGTDTPAAAAWTSTWSSSTSGPAGGADRLKERDCRTGPGRRAARQTRRRVRPGRRHGRGRGQGADRGCGPRGARPRPGLAGRAPPGRSLPPRRAAPPSRRPLPSRRRPRDRRPARRRTSSSSGTASAASRRTAGSTSSSSTATPRRPAAAAGPVDQCPGQPRLWLPDDRHRVGLHLGRQQPDEPADALVQRPGVRSARGSGLPA